MLVLSRKRGESIVIDGQIKVTISEVHGNRVKLVIDAPRSRKVMRCEIASDLEPAVTHRADRELATSAT